MPVPLGIPEQIEVALQALFAGIVADGTNYNHTVSACLREPLYHGQCQDPKKDCVYVLSPDSPTEEEAEQASSLRAETRLRLVLVASKQYRPKDETPFSSETPKRITVQQELERDVKRAIATQLQPATKPLGVDGVFNIQVTTVDRSEEFTYYEGWATVRFQIAVLFEYKRLQP